MANVMEKAVAVLMEYGFGREEALNLWQTVRADSPEKLVRDAKAWLAWCCEIKQAHDCIVDLAAKGVIYVELGPGGIEDLRMGLKNEVMEGVKP